MTRAAIYTRVSTEEQASDDKTSLAFQREKGEAYCGLHDLEVAKVYEDAGVSGTTDDRPALKELLADAEVQRFQHVVIYKLDRLARNARILLNISHGLKELDVGLASVMENIDTSGPAGRMFFTIMASVAEFDRDSIVERMTNGIYAQVKSGKMYRASTPPYGYRYNRKTRQLEIREDTAAIVRRIYQMYIEGSGMHSIATRLSDQNVPVPSAGTKRTNELGWHTTRVRHILRSPVYVGKGTYGKEKLPMACPPIIEDETFEKVQGLIQRHRDHASRNTKRFYLLQGLLFCGHCGGRYSSVSHGERKVYRCLKRSNYGKKRGGHEDVKWHYPAKKLDEAVKRFLRVFMSRPKLILPHIERHVGHLVQRAEELGGQAGPLKKQLEDLKAEEERILDLAQKGIYKDEAQMFVKLDKVRAEQTEVGKLLKRLSRSTASVDEAREGLTRLRQEIMELLVECQVKDPEGETTLRWKEYTDEKWRQAIRYLIQKIIINDDGTLSFKGLLVVPGVDEAANLPLPESVSSSIEYPGPQ